MNVNTTCLTHDDRPSPIHKYALEAEKMSDGTVAKFGSTLPGGTAIRILILVLFIFGVLSDGLCNDRTKPQELRVGTELDFPPYAFTDKMGKPTGFSIDLINAVSKAMGLSINISSGSWDTVWNALVADEIDLLPIVAKTPQRQDVVEFSLPHTETYDTFFVREGDTPPKDMAAAEGMEVIAMRSDAAHHELLGHNFKENLILVNTLPEGLSLLSSGKHDALLCSKMIGSLLIKKLQLENLSAGAPIPDYKRVFSFAVRKGDFELQEKLNQGLLIVKTNGEYDRIYENWLTVDDPFRRIKKYFLPLIIGVAALLLIAGIWLVTLQRQVQKRNDELVKRKQIEEELRESEGRFRTLFEKAPLAYQSLDEQGNYIAVNDTWLEVMGYSRAEVIDKNFSEFLHEEWKDHFKEKFPRFKAVGEVLGNEFVMQKKDGTEIYVSFHGKIGKTAMGEFRQTHCVFYDITEQKKAAQYQKQLEEQLLQSRKMESIGNLAGGIAHEFNNMLAIIIGNNELLMKELPQSSFAKECAEDIRSAGLRAKDVVKQLLTFSRQDNAAQKVIDLRSEVQEAMKLIRSSTPANIQIEQTFSDNTYPVMANGTQVNQLLINICNNALDAVPENGGKIAIELCNETIDEDTQYVTNVQPGRYVKLVISDNGSGMDSETIDRMFEPFFTTKDIGKGSGIGMAVVHGIVKQCGGVIIADSHVGQGTTFTIFFPAYDGHSEKKTGEQNSRPTGNENILIVDDEPSIVKLSKRLLENLGYKTETTTDPEKALEMVKRDPKKFDLVVSDMAMPSMTGKNMIIEILKIRKDMPTIICTGYSAKISAEEASEIGINAHLMKPLSTSELAVTVRRVLDEARQPGV